MTAPIRMPAVTVYAAPANPLPGGLYAAATMPPFDGKYLETEIEVVPINQGALQIWELGCDAENDDKGIDTDVTPVAFPAFGLVATDVCSIVGRTAEQANTSARQQMRLLEQAAVERQTATLLLSRAGAPGAAAGGIIGALGRIEAALSVSGVAGVVHASATLAALAVSERLVEKVGGKYYTPMGHQWAFGHDYLDLGQTLVGTGPVTIYRSPIVENTAVGHRQNQRLAVVERQVTVTWELETVAALVA